MPTTIFPFGRPAGPEDIVDREDFLREVCQRLWDGHSVMLASPRRTGKSSVAGEVLRRLRARGAYTASVDLFHVTGVEEFGVKLLRSVLENRTGPHQRALRALRGLREWLGSAEVRARLHDLELGFSVMMEKPEPEEVLETAIHWAEQLAARDGRRMVVLLDEFQEVDRLGGDALFKRLRAHFQQQRHAVYLFLGSQTTLMHTIFADRRHAFYRFALPLELPPIPDEAWADYIARRLGEHGLSITSPALQELLDHTGGHPYCVMAVAYHAYLNARLRGATDITADTVLWAFEETLEHLDEFYAVQWAEIRRVQHADAVLRALVEGEPPYRLPLHPAVVSKAIRYLQRVSVVVKGDGRGAYRLVEPMFGEWIRRHAR